MLFQNFHSFFDCALLRDLISRGRSKGGKQIHPGGECKCRGGYRWTWSLIFEERGGQEDGVLFFKRKKLSGTVFAGRCEKEF